MLLRIYPGPPLFKNLLWLPPAYATDSDQTPQPSLCSSQAAPLVCLRICYKLLFRACPPLGRPSPLLSTPQVQPALPHRFIELLPVDTGQGSKVEACPATVGRGEVGESGLRQEAVAGNCRQHSLKNSSPQWSQVQPG